MIKETIRNFLHLSRRNLLFYLSQRIDYPLVPPDTMQLIFLFRCNLRCVMCDQEERMRFHISQGKKYEIDTPTLERLIKQASIMGIKEVILVGGEPLVREDIVKIVDLVNKNNMICVIVTNGTLLNREIIKEFFKVNLSCFSISIDAATEETFKKIRGENVLKKIKENIRLLNQMKREEKRNIPSIVSVCTVSNLNIEELLEVLYQAQELGIYRVYFQPVLSDNTNQFIRDTNVSTWIPRERCSLMEKAIDDVIRFKLENEYNFELVGNSIYFLNLMKEYFKGTLKSQKFHCYAGYNRILVTQDSRIYLCAETKEIDSSFGDLTKDNLAQLWYSKEAKAHRKLIRNCPFPCLQLCSYRMDFMEWEGILQKFWHFKLKRLFR